MTSKKQTAEIGKGKPGPGRPKGVPNKTTAILKDAILLAAEDVGEDGKGKDGLQGYLRFVAASDVKAFATLIGKVLPMTVAGDSENPLALEFRTVYEGKPK